MNKFNERVQEEFFKKKMKPKVLYAEDKITLYLCPECENGHLIDYMQEMCDRCGVEFDWSLKDE